MVIKKCFPVMFQQCDILIVTRLYFVCCQKLLYMVWIIWWLTLILNHGCTMFHVLYKGFNFSILVWYFFVIIHLYTEEPIPCWRNILRNQIWHRVNTRFYRNNSWIHMEKSWETNYSQRKLTSKLLHICGLFLRKQEKVLIIFNIPKRFSITTLLRLYS